ncbi:MAG TPA: DUF2157 domain-containing protein [Anaeromyxobacter sp.]|nr:DUF2157 domain-containing protein [Anaeromyxobacter sp.]
MTDGSRRFREGLRRELPRWREEGLVSPDAAAALEARYRLAELPTDGPGLLPVYVLGALLVGAGVVSLVAWNWEAMGVAAKLVVLGLALVGCHAAGFALWKGNGRAPRLGHALTLLGTLVFGADIGLVAQIFHVSGVWWGAFGAFAGGALAAALLYRSLPHHLLAVVLALGVWGPGLAHDHPRAGIAVGYGVAALSLAVALRERSRALAVLAALGLPAVLLAAVPGEAAHGRYPDFLGGLLLVPAAVASALACAPLLARGEAAVRIAAAVRVVGRLGFALVAFLLSFSSLARELRLRGAVPPLLLAAALPALLAASGALLAGLRRPDVDPLARGEAFLLAATTVALALGHGLEGGVGTALVANLALAFLALGRIVRGLRYLERGPFWEGMAIAGLLVLARFLETEVVLWLKGAAFIACGAAVLSVGLAFERRRHRREVSDVA